jgi:hypothetical protein
MSDAAAVRPHLLHDDPEGTFLVYRSGPVSSGIGNRLLELELAYGVFTADRTALAAQDVDRYLDALRAALVQTLNDGKRIFL